jgi:hypothetical protein
LFIPDHSIALQELGDDVFDLNSQELASRMDLILDSQTRECYPGFIDNTEIPDMMNKLQTFLETKIVAQFDEERKKESLLYAFEFHVQMAIGERISGFSNHLIYTLQYDETLSWRSPLTQIRSAAITQATIVLSRVTFEKFMNLAYYLENGKPINPGKKKSKLSHFFNYLKTSQFVYFLPKLSKVRIYDSDFRTGEVHKKSGVVRQVLKMSHPSFESSNQPLSLTNMNLGLWKPMIEILNGRTPQYYQGDQNEHLFFKAYLSGGIQLKEAIEEVEKQFQEL